MAYHHRDTDKLLAEAVVFVRSKNRITVPKRLLTVGKKRFFNNYWLEMLMQGSYYGWSFKPKDGRVCVPYAEGTRLSLEIYQDESAYKTIEVHKLGPYSN